MWKPSGKAIEISEDDKARSEFARTLIKTESTSSSHEVEQQSYTPKVIVQFWHDQCVPDDVAECIETWKKLKSIGYEHVLYSNDKAREFIKIHFGNENTKAYDRCYHPAMKSDYFRLCYIYCKGGLYVDVDDIFNGAKIDHLFEGGQLKLQPLCYDISSDQMVSSRIFFDTDEFSNKWIYYFNNNPILATSKNPIIEYALRRSTKILLEYNEDVLPEVQSTAGPGNLTASIVAYFYSHTSPMKEKDLSVLSDWEVIAKTIWELNYRNDSRNWRLSNMRNYYMEVF
ncbi:MAG: hypothetical protein JAZ19_14055 [Candidatus Thiodiazotropha taylori]|nr:hypothetical protein [Candidatus Thiodiazotropha taylori]